MLPTFPSHSPVKNFADTVRGTGFDYRIGPAEPVAHTFCNIRFDSAAHAPDIITPKIPARTVVVPMLWRRIPKKEGTTSSLHSDSSSVRPKSPTARKTNGIHCTADTALYDPLVFIRRSKRTTHPSPEEEKELTTKVYNFHNEIDAIIKDWANGGAPDGLHADYDKALVYANKRKEADKKTSRHRKHYVAARKEIIRNNRRLSSQRRAILLDGLRAQEEMIVRNLGLVSHTLKSKFGGRADFSNQYEDLFQAASPGLERALERFDPSMDTKFSTYARYWISALAHRHLINHGHEIRVPVHVRDEIRRVDTITARLRDVLDHEPTVEEICEAANLTVPQLKRIRSARSLLQVVSLATPISDEGDRLLGDVLPDPHTDEDVVIENLHQNIRAQVLLRAMHECLNERERDVLMRYYGFGDYDESNLREVGTIYKLSRERIRQIKAAAIAKLKKYFNKLIKSKNNP